MMRAGFFGSGIPTHYDVGYLTQWSLALTLLGAAAVYRVRDRIQIN
jgi:ABC-type polysaccharide/polyol phosphate export permease